jgi:hypothetical protein
MNLFSAHICILSIHMTLKQRIQPTLKIMFLLRPLPLHPNRRKILNKILRYKWWFHFSNCRCLIHMQQYYRSTSVWGLHFTTHPLFWGLWNIILSVGCILCFKVMWIDKMQICAEKRFISERTSSIWRELDLKVWSNCPSLFLEAVIISTFV